MSTRQALRTAFTAGLGNAFASLSGVEFGQYVALAVLAVSTESYGGTIELGRQRILGTVLGSVLLVVGYEGLRTLPLPLALAITLGSLRLLGGLLKLQGGYKVGGMIIVMGWLVHEGGLAEWIPIRLFWTAFGVLITLLGLRLFWPARGVQVSLGLHADLLQLLRRCYGDLADRRDPGGSATATALPGTRQHRALRDRLIAIRRQHPALMQELGPQPLRHPALQLLLCLEDTASRLIRLVAVLERESPRLEDGLLIGPLRRAEAELLQAMAHQLGDWEQQLRAAGPLPQPPQSSLRLPRSWTLLTSQLDDPTAKTVSLEQLARLAARLQLCRQAAEAIVDGETRWRAILQES